MSASKNPASAFTIGGLTAAKAATSKKYPIEEIALCDIEEHPSNTAYSMDEGAIKKLAKSIKQDGLTDMPLVRKLDSGNFQMISGHRRKAAYSQLAKTDEKYSKLPCRIIENITDESAETLLHAANYFTRELTITERAAASKALGLKVEEIRKENDEFAGMRTEDIKAKILSEQTGKKVSGRTIRENEKLAEMVQENLSPSWQKQEQNLTAKTVKKLANLDQEKQEEIYNSLPKVDDEQDAKKVVSKHVATCVPKPKIQEENKANIPSSAQYITLKNACVHLRKYEENFNGDMPQEEEKLIEEMNEILKTFLEMTNPKKS